MEKHFKPRQSAQLLWDNITLTALQSHSQSNSFPDKILHFTIRFSSLNFSNLPMINSEQRFENLPARSLHALLCQELLSDFCPFKISNGMSRLLFCSNFPEHSCSLSPSPICQIFPCRIAWEAFLGGIRHHWSEVRKLWGFSQPLTLKLLLHCTGGLNQNEVGVGLRPPPGVSQLT